MDSIFHRLKYYGIGFGVGLIFVIFFFQNRGCSWLPDNRVKNSILDRVLVLPESEAKQMNKFGLTKKDLTLVLNDGEVLFEESKKTGNPKVYVVEKEIPSKGKVKFFFTLANESFISEIHFTEKNVKKIKSEKSSYIRRSFIPGNSKSLWNAVKKAKDQNISFLPENLTLNNLPINPSEMAD